MSILLQKKNVGGYSYMSSPNIYYRAQLKELLDMGAITDEEFQQKKEELLNKI